MEENDILDMATKIQATDNLDSKLDYLEQLKTSCKSLKRRLKRRRRRELRNTAKIDWINTLPTEEYTTKRRPHARMPTMENTD
ncbi:hypothetical protein FRC17_010795 [Serendipita sp. 399]|nr:hypothetical protein FRC17_010795 [Serendipita sp. 399]